jgi:hypothetical protein
LPRFSVFPAEGRNREFGHLTSPHFQDVVSLLAVFKWFN